MTSQAIIKFLSVIFFISLAHSALAQYKVKGNVYDSSHVYPIEGVVVVSTGGKMAITDSMGHYQIDVAEKDSVWFSFQGKPTPKYAVLKIADVNAFDIALRLKWNVMQEVKIKTRNYKLDSLQNRRDYAKVFNYRKVSLGSMTSIGPMGAGIDIDELIRLFQFKKNRNMLKFQQRLIEQERDKFVDHRFTKALVHKLTGLDGNELNIFMLRYRPGFEFTSITSDYDFQLYIKNAFEEFRSRKSF